MTREDKQMVVKDAPKSSEPQKVILTGVVDSISGRKTVRVAVNRLTKHPLYGKYVRHRKRMLVHDAREEARIGDTIELTQSRPISKSKSWRLVRVTKRNVMADTAITEEATEK